MQEEINNTMILHACGICDREFGHSNLVPLVQASHHIASSGLKLRFEELIAPMHNADCCSSERAYAAALHNELEDGVRKGAEYVCDDCYKQLKKRNTTPESFNSIPDLALVNGYFRGRRPSVFDELNPTELSLITIINVVTRLIMLPRGSHWSSSTGTTFSVMNDVTDVSEELPVALDRGFTTVIIRTEGTRSPKMHTCNPRKVLSALYWLERNNPYYKGIVKLPEVGEPAHALWANGGVDENVEIPHIEATNEDYDGLEESALQQPAGADGHAVNPGAPASAATDMLLYSQQSLDARQQMVAIAQQNISPAVVMVRARGDYTYDHEVEGFMCKAFPELYPYGKGGPGQAGVVFNGSYVRNMLLLGGGREFQQCTRFIFYSYTWVMRRQVGSISWLASRRNGNADVDEFTAADARALLEELGSTSDPHAQPTQGGVSRAKIRSLLNRLQPYVESVPGTEMYFARERKKLLAMVASPATTSLGRWTWFLTDAQSDMFAPEIYDNAVSSAIGAPEDVRSGSLESRRAYSDALTAAQRMDILRAHPFLSARLHAAQRVAYWQNILCGARKPLGHIVDYWMRVEFQMKGTPHLHSLINVSRDSMPGITASSITSKDPAERQRVMSFVRKVATARLEPRDDGNDDDLRNDDGRDYRLELERLWTYNVERQSYFRDRSHPARSRFNGNWNYSMNSVKDSIVSAAVRYHYRRLQLAYQMHLCRDSCYKYCRRGRPKTCRYGFTKVRVPQNDQNCIIVQDRDNRSRIRVRVLPPRNNGNINNHMRNPLCFIASRGNQDIQYIQNTTGGAEYVSKYVSKADTAETTVFQNAVNRALARAAAKLPEHETLSFRCHLQTVGNAVLAAQQVGAVQACYVLGKLPFVISSRDTVWVNCLRRGDIGSRPILLAEDELADLADDASALVDSPLTQMGKRDAYHRLYKQQVNDFGSMEVNFYAFLSCYSVKRLTRELKENSKIKVGADHLRVDSSGYIATPKSFVLGKVGHIGSSFGFI
jgi:hypothetical protein